MVPGEPVGHRVDEAAVLLGHFLPGGYHPDNLVVGHRHRPRVKTVATVARTEVSGLRLAVARRWLDIETTLDGREFPL